MTALIRKISTILLHMLVSKRNGKIDLPNVGDRFTHRKLGSTWMLMAYYEPTHEFFMISEDTGKNLTVTAEGFKNTFRRFGEYNEKDLV